MPRGKKECPSCKDLLSSRSAAVSSDQVFRRKAKAKKTNNLSVLSRLVEVPDKNKRQFYQREFKIMNSLSERYSLEFLAVLDFGKKFDSLAYILSYKLKDTLDQKWRAFNYKFDKDKYMEYNIGDKTGEDKIIKKKNKTTRDFLNE